MSKSPSINQRTVLRQIRKGEVSGTDLHRCAINIVAQLGMHPSCTGAVEDILEKLVRQGRVRLRHSELRCESPRRAATSGHKKFDRSQAMRQGRVLGHLDPEAFQPDPTTSVPPAWRGVDPSEYASPKPSLDPAGGWDEDAVFDYHLETAERKEAIRLLALEQFIDGTDSLGIRLSEAYA